MILPNAASTVTVGTLAVMFAVMTAKHVLADFILQTRWMALGKDARVGWAKPLLVHCAIHGVTTTAVVVMIEPRLWYLGVVDFVLHTACDRAKGFTVSRLALSPSDAWFWWLLGFDQAFHHATDFALAVVLSLNG